MNASYGAASPTSADAGGFELSQTAFNLDVSYPLEYQSSLIIWRVVLNFVVKDTESMRVNLFPGLTPDSVQMEAASGIQVFPGFRPNQETDESRTNVAGYADFESYMSGEPGSGLLVGAAVRGEQYSDFGATVTGKATARYDFTKQVALRAAGSTGFRALHCSNSTSIISAHNSN